MWITMSKSLLVGDCCLAVTVSLSLSVTNVTEVVSAVVSVRKEFTHMEVDSGTLTA